MYFIFRGMIDGVEAMTGIGKRLREARLAAGMSQEEVGRRIGLTQVGYGAFERGDTLVNVEYLVALSRLFDKSVTYFLGLPHVTLGDLSPTTVEVAQILEEGDAETRKRILDFAKYHRQQCAQEQG